jgi:ubiquinol-cytochrome c reductase cytochrome b subunit
MTGAALFPFIEQWVTGDRRSHHLNDRPRNAPVRTAIGVTAVTFYGVLWLAGGNDIIANTFHVSLFATTWFFRFAIVIAPVAAFVVTKRACLGLQRGDAATIGHGVESGVIRQLPSGEFVEMHVRARPQQREIILSKAETPVAELPGADANGIPAPSARGPLGAARARLRRFWYADPIAIEPAAAHAADTPHAADTADTVPAQLAADAAEVEPSPTEPGGEHRQLTRG